jgi:hypothetical protein
MKSRSTCHTSSLTVCIVLGAVFFGLASPGWARDFEWSGGAATDDWQLSANWTDLGTGGVDDGVAGIPDGADTATFPNGVSPTPTNIPASVALVAVDVGGGNTVTLGANLSTGSLNVSSGTLAIGGNTVSVGAGGAAISGTLDGTAPGAAVSVTGDLDVSGGTLTTGGNSISVTGNVDFETAASVNIGGNLNLPPAGPNNLVNGDPLNVTLASVEVADGRSVTVTDPGAFGTFEVGFLSVDGTFTADVATEVTAATDVSGTGSATFSGALSTNSLNVSGTLDANGNAVTATSTVNFAGGTFTDPPTGGNLFLFNGGGAQAFTPGGQNFGDVQVSTGGTAVTQTGTAIMDSLIVDATTTYSLDGGAAAVTLQITNGGSITNNGVFDVADDTNTVTVEEESGTGTFTFSGTDIDFNNNTIYLGRATYQPAVVLAAGERIILSDDVTFDNTIDLNANSDFETQTFTLSTTNDNLNLNAGSSTLTIAGGAVDLGTGALTNAGVIDTSGSITTGAFTSTGTVTNTAANTITASGNVSIGGTFNSPANSTLTMTGSGPETLSASVSIGALNINGDKPREPTGSRRRSDPQRGVLDHRCRSRYHPRRRLDQQWGDFRRPELSSDDESRSGHLHPYQQRRLRTVLLL